MVLTNKQSGTLFTHVKISCLPTLFRKSLLCLIYPSLILPSFIFGQYIYWDVDGNTAGASSGTTANGNWADSSWSNNSNGNVSTSNWTNTNTAHFSAGSDATGNSSIVANLSSVVLTGITVEEGNVFITAGSGDLTLSGTANFSISENSSLSISESLLYGGNTLNKAGKGLFTFGANNVDASGTTTISQGKIDVASGVTLSGGVTGSGSLKSVIGGLGTVDSVTLGGSSNEIDFISPGLGNASSLTSSSSQNQISTQRSSDAVGTFTATTLNWNNGGVYDWEIKDFNPGTTSGAYDVLSFSTLNFESGQTFGINIMSVSDGAGTIGSVASGNTVSSDFSGNSGFLFLKGSTVNGIGSGDVSSSFSIRTDDFDFQQGHWYGDWGVYRDGGNFYLTYSAVPEPSTYAMVFVLCGFLALNRSSFRYWKKLKSFSTRSLRNFIRGGICLYAKRRSHE